MKRFLYLLMLLAVPCFGAPTSENNPRLKSALEKHPEADANKDGILTMSEAKAFKAKAQGGGKGGQKGGQKGGKKGGKKGGDSVKAKADKERTASGTSIKPGAEIKGYNGLYMGHSFFRPSALLLLQVIRDTNIANHTEYIIKDDGPKGSPGFLWDNENNRQMGLSYLDRGKANLLVMTYFSPANSSIEHYRRWFDAAKSRNPEITFMVTIPWRLRPHELDDRALVDEEEETKALYESLIVPLRKHYPDNRILFCPYGLGVYELMRRLNEGRLPGVKYVLNPNKAARAQSQKNKEQLVNDETGHGGELIEKLGALIWLQTLYGYDLSTLKPQRVKGLPDIDLNEIAAEVYKKIIPYNAVYRDDQIR